MNFIRPLSLKLVTRARSGPTARDMPAWGNAPGPVKDGFRGLKARNKTTVMVDATLVCVSDFQPSLPQGQALVKVLDRVAANETATR